MTKSNESGRKSGQLKGTSLALVTVLAVVVGVAVGMYIPQVHQTYLTETQTSTLHTTETKSHTVHIIETLLTTRTNTRTNTITETRTLATIATTITTTEMIPPVSHVWEKTYDGGGYDRAESIVHSGDGQFIVGGRTSSFGAGGLDAYVLKIDGDGNRIWEKAYGGSDDDEAIGVVQSGDGGFIVAGLTVPEFDDVYLLKIDADGNKVWEKAYGGGDADRAYHIVPSEDDGFIVVGVTCSFGAGYMDVYLLKIDGDGNKIWETTYGGREDDEPWEIINTEDGEFIVIGWTMSFAARDADAYLLKIKDNT